MGKGDIYTMKNTSFEPKHNQVLESVRPQIEKLTRTRRKLVAAEAFAALVMLCSLYFLIF